MHSEFIQKLTNIVEANLANETFGPNDLVREAGMSHSNLNRKLKIISNQNISQFIRELRLKKAKELLLIEDLTVAEISYRIGFGSPTYFNKCFREYFGFAPGQLRNWEPDKSLMEQPVEQPVEPQPKTPKRIKILISLVIGLMVLIPTTFFLIHNVADSKAENVKEKSIALLPFKYLSDEPEKQYLADGMMDAILLHLSKIKDLRVISRTSVEQYRKTDKTSKTIGQELDVEYVLEGSFLKEGDKVRLILQLIKTNNDDHSWANEYDRDWKDVFSVQSEVAETIARELRVVITPGERQLIRKKPTNNLTAFDFYQRAKDELDKYQLSSQGDTTALKKAQHFFRKAMELDSTFALSYTGLAAIYYEKYYWKDYLSKNYMDSVIILANKALTFDNQCAEAYYLRAHVYSETSRTAEALNEIDRALKFNPNDWKAYFLRSSIFEALNDYVGTISNRYDAVLRNRGTELPTSLTRFSYKLATFGYPDLAKKYNQQALELHGDSTRYLFCLAYSEYCNRNFENAYQIAKRADKRDSTFRFLHRWPDIAMYCMITGRYKEAYSLSLKFYQRLKKAGEIDPTFSRKIAYYLLQTGKTKEADFYFNEEIKYDLESIKLGRLDGTQGWAYFDLAEVYASLGNKGKAYYYLDEVNKNQSIPWYWMIFLRYEHYFDNIRKEPRFQKIQKKLELKYQAEHKRLGKWLQEKGLL